MAKDQSTEPQLDADADRDLQEIVAAAVEKGREATTTELKNQLRALVEKNGAVSTITETTKTSALKTILGFLFRKKDKGINNEDEEAETSETTSASTPETITEEIATELVKKYETLERNYNECVARLNTSLEQNKVLQESLKQFGINVGPDADPKSKLWDFLGNVNPNSTVQLSYALQAAKGKISEMNIAISSLKTEIKDLKSTVKSLEENIETLKKSTTEETISKKFTEERDDLNRRINLLTDASTEQEGIITGLEEQVQELTVKLQESTVKLQERDALISQLHNASSGIVKIKEDLLEEAQSFAAKIQEAIEEVRTVNEGKTLASYFTFETNKEITDECLVICNQLQPNILGNITMYSTTIQAYAKLLEEIAKNGEIPSLSLLKRSLEILGKLKALKELQDQLIADTMNEQAGAEDQNQAQEEPEQEDYYTILGVDPSATTEEIVKAYRKLAIELHPDTNGGDKDKTERFIKVKEAYETLSDTRKRQTYDDLRARRQSQAA